MLTFRVLFPALLYALCPSLVHAFWGSVEKKLNLRFIMEISFSKPFFDVDGIDDDVASYFSDISQVGQDSSSRMQFKAMYCVGPDGERTAVPGQVVGEERYGYEAGELWEGALHPYFCTSGVLLYDMIDLAEDSHKDKGQIELGFDIWGEEGVGKFVPGRESAIVLRWFTIFNHNKYWISLKHNLWYRGEGAPIGATIYNVDKLRTEAGTQGKLINSVDDWKKLLQEDTSKMFYFAMKDIRIVDGVRKINVHDKLTLKISEGTGELKFLRIEVQEGAKAKLMDSLRLFSKCENFCRVPKYEDGNFKNPTSRAWLVIALFLIITGLILFFFFFFMRGNSHSPSSSHVSSPSLEGLGDSPSIPLREEGGVDMVTLPEFPEE